MSAWLDYRLSDFLMYSPRVYHRMLELYNVAVWPVHVVALSLGFALMVFAVRGGARAVRPMSAMLCAAWVWVAAAFLHQRYATINWAADYIAIAFVVQALWLAWVALRVRPQSCQRWARPGPIRMIGLGLMAFAVFLYPFLAPVQGRPWTGAELYGLMPDPTLIATLGVLLIWRGPFRLWGAIVPLVCCLASGATSWTLGEPLAWLMPLMAIIASGALLRDRLSGKSVR